MKKRTIYRLVQSNVNITFGSFFFYSSELDLNSSGYHLKKKKSGGFKGKRGEEIRLDEERRIFLFKE